MLKTVQIDSAQLSLYDSGETSEEITLLLLHGFPLDHTMWCPVIETLRSDIPVNPRLRVLAPDLRGMGASTIDASASQTGVTMAEYADDLAAMLDGLQITQPVVLCGFSLGGYIAWEFYRRHREKLRAMVLADTKAAADLPEGRATRLKMAENIERWGSPHVARMMTSKLYAPATLEQRPAFVDEIEQVVARTHPVAIAAAQRGMAGRSDSRPLLPTIDLPVLYLVGSEDAISPPEEMEAMAQATPDGELQVIAGAGHMSPVEAAEAFTASLGEWLFQLAEVQ